MKTSLALVSSSLVLLSAHQARAQYNVPSQASRSSTDDSAKEQVMIATGQAASAVAVAEGPPTPWELGASINFLTSEASAALGDEALEFTDLTLLRLHGLVTLGRFDLFAGTDILPKQPSFTDELVWQGSMLGLRTSLGKQFATYARAQGGPKLGRGGYWADAEAAVQYHYALQKVLFFESSLGWAHTQVHDDGVADTRLLEEAFTRVGLAVREPRRGLFAAWFNFDYFVPVYARPDVADSNLGLDPQPRVNVHVGALGAITEHVDLFFEFTILDRGDIELAQTTLPVLYGGFDQVQVVFGFMRHFGGYPRGM